MNTTIRQIALILAAITAAAPGLAGMVIQPIEFYSPAQRSSAFDGCSDLFPGGRPIPLTIVSQEWKPRGLCSDSFAVLHSGRSKTPLVVVERMNHAQLLDAKGEPRFNQFFPDPRLPDGERAHLDDYKGSGFDRGHMAAAGNAPTPNAMAQSFSLANIVPQDPTNNQKIWKKLETDTRKYAKRAQGDVFVFTGPIFDPGYETIGRNKIWVPTRLFKLVYDQATGRAWAHVLPNISNARIDKPMDYAGFVRETGLDLLKGVQISGTASQ